MKSLQETPREQIQRLMADADDIQRTLNIVRTYLASDTNQRAMNMLETAKAMADDLANDIEDLLEVLQAE